MNWQILEALSHDGDGPPMKFRVRLIKAGLSNNNNYYPLSVLREAVALFNGARVRAIADEDHVSGRKGSIRDLVAGISDATVDDQGLVGTVTVSEAEKWLAVKMNDALNGIPGFFGFSLVAEAVGKVIREAGRITRRVSKITKVKFVDAVVDPSAGGEILGLAEAITEMEDGAMREKLLKLLEAKAPALYAEIDAEKISDEDLATVVAEAVQETKDQGDTDDKDKDAGGDKVDLKEADDKTGMTDLKVIEALLDDFRKEVREGYMEDKAKEKAEKLFIDLFAESKLPEDARTSVRARIADGKVDDPKAIVDAVKAERKYLAEAAGFTGPGSFARIANMVDSRDKNVAGLEGLFLGEAQAVDGDDKNKIDPFISIKEAYIGITGDAGCTGMTADAVNLSEAEITSGSWAGLLRDAIHKAIQREYGQTGMDLWKAVADIVPVADFRTNYRPQMGGFSNLASVAESAAYGAFTTEPDDFEPSYSVTKYGRTQDLTLETIINDDVGAVQRMPKKMARAAMRTLSAAVWAPILNNSNVTYEATALFHADHGANLGSAALSPTTVSAGRLAMQKQAEPQSAERLGLNPKWLVVPVDLAQTAFEICYPDNKPLLATDTTDGGTSENQGIPNFYKTFNLTPLVITEATDTNNWFMAADKGDVPLVEVGFLGGRQEPELFVADLPSHGSMFTDDLIKYKIRLIFGVCVLDHRGWYGAIVA